MQKSMLRLLSNLYIYLRILVQNIIITKIIIIISTVKVLIEIDIVDYTKA
jgi:hypothetical protein